MYRHIVVILIITLLLTSCATVRAPIKRARHGPADMTGVHVTAIGAAHKCVQDRDGRHVRLPVAQSKIPDLSRLTGAIGASFDIWLENGLVVNWERLRGGWKDYSVPAVDKLTCQLLGTPVPFNSSNIAEPALVIEGQVTVTDLEVRAQTRPSTEPLTSTALDRDTLIAICAQARLISDSCPFDEPTCIQIDTMLQNCAVN